MEGRIERKKKQVEAQRQTVDRAETTLEQAREKLASLELELQELQQLRITGLLNKHSLSADQLAELLESGLVAELMNGAHHGQG